MCSVHPICFKIIQSSTIMRRAILICFPLGHREQLRPRKGARNIVMDDGPAHSISKLEQPVHCHGHQRVVHRRKTVREQHCKNNGAAPGTPTLPRCSQLLNFYVITVLWHCRMSCPSVSWCQLHEQMLHEAGPKVRWESKSPYRQAQKPQTQDIHIKKIGYES